MTASLAKLIENRYGGARIPVEVVLPDGGRVRLADTPDVQVIAHTLRGLTTLAQPALGRLAQAYVRNDIDFTGSARRVLAVAERMVGEIRHGHTSVTGRLRLWLHQRRPSRANIAHHYDVSNDFYRLWLDPRMVYSCAYYRHDGDSLEEAQAAKLDHICRKLRLAPGDRLLDVGCGWGALIFWAAEHYGVDATGITLSQRQIEHCDAEIARRGLGGRARVEMRNYRDLPADASFDKIVSVGMFEHVGVSRLPEYFAVLRGALKPGGIVLNHGITHNQVHGEVLGSGIGEFIDAFVFPGGELTHVSRVLEAMSRAGLEVFDAEALREHYAKTLWHWTERLEASAEAARAEIGEERYRIWRIYMAGSAHAFERGWLSLWQLAGGRPHPDGRLPHPLTREDLYLPRAGA